ncbi:tRNA (adenosine(37)-N6)-threonylcarbamoyltransferase complex ATPase subunit type 1 TsaE [Methyloversatilis sp.]|uniref:tRNA (adenosine(37)-N6)-threonylcarbamoyltransferase complex ATPase subunit type 1 TsaE n=1 Tax=Methyloversatilis sp. TaxID=2569862 RepID=UPI0027342EF8|nr:tRNA (adenosine(37)-N6)-threonylcarbamoyltransferase complex ATPase subunit type 1 TsaE [Methyloversatilis sp.]MDP2869443.1 tRNA (adenosine(37)-N6)-threonylcarbamoyltransferase complex ATPase subunit type 1 TsaE [Methyloversatilis sp.]MDP3455283.1 tRNA (adenosine(37)-N6)-threonylcarbamoyltransferase complex ATPase subunit type 1 TsaE [Methyloversatilis sp.]MDP3578477.1 tRNA (adenosine(37)-N6)-threonylcarbamoyltransferase complex ATPase subunit type 1 TsaE [Methyloversatilis sp.]
MTDFFSIDLADTEETEALGARLAAILCPGLTLFLDGDLGAGKTTLVRGVLRALGHIGKVKSPTFTLLESYAISSLNFPLYHFDFYRFTDPDEFIEAGLDEYFGQTGPAGGVCLVEWPDKAGGHLPPPDLRIGLAVVGDARRAQLSACSDAGRACLERLIRRGAT